MATAKATVEGIFVPKTPGAGADTAFEGEADGIVGWLVSITKNLA